VSIQNLPGNAPPPTLEVRDLDVSIHGEAASFLVVRDMAFEVRSARRWRSSANRAAASR
jgi:hypothetical protein